MSQATRERGGKSRSGGRGWAAFDREQRLKGHGLLESKLVEDPFPALAPSISKPNRSTSTGTSTSTSTSNDENNNIAAAVDEHIGMLQSTRLDHNISYMTMNANDQNKKHYHRRVGSSSSLAESAEEKLRSCDSGACKAVPADIPVSAMVEGFKDVPVEPEWEEDDVYLRHRKEALRTMRSASQHSKVATRAYLRGDHVSAHQHSLMAHHEWLAAQTLNVKAAKDILSIRNSQNDVWKLDLHGLHAAEAIQVLQHHLHNIETKLLCNRSVSPNSLKMEARIVRSNSLESFDCFDAQNLDKQHQASLKQRPTSLQVITGVGNHSRGKASLPAAVRGFLDENGYRFEELKPGVLMVRPKFRLLT
ncbi:polyadenylate-binding protein-interacting protein 7 [Morus notabilis]|uniref:polyadenylate-binding protein-interacting protein 7 n=1 Tax=Morus notabilis TaxID=981085 RepID=UPI000CED5CD4|nr:polyadenylate-binding protein-interacting protein 7 [Morus notabilis]XP_024022141.1 polyadenylate-binding protein-interacting protein 7 [Morus notabilis]XP_024022142.1 polyadenylate-binding protein-interacting protein 7 [Morus notabilis]